MIYEFHVQNYKALSDVKLKLTPMHVLIGPNDSGKTSILEALGALCRSVEMPLGEAFQGRWDGRELVSHGQAQPSVLMHVEGIERHDSDFRYSLEVRFHEQVRQVTSTNESLALGEQTKNVSSSCQQTHVCQSTQNSSPSDDSIEAAIRHALQNVHQYHWKPRNLALPVAADRQRQLRMEQSGFGLAQLLDDIAGSNPSRYLELQTRFRRVFPQVTALKLITTRAYKANHGNLKEVEQFTEQDGRGLFLDFEGIPRSLSASQVSDGMLLVLAYLALLYSPEPPSLLLIEEPENGIHPKLLDQVITILRELVAENGKTQVIMTTHSPYMVDLFQPEEVTLCVKDESGDVNVRQFSDIEKVRKQSKVFTMGEIWTGVGDEALAKDAGVEVAPIVESEVTTP